MDILFKCGKCGKRLAVDVKGSGIITTCPSCSSSLTVPDSALATCCPKCSQSNLVAEEQFDEEVECPSCGLGYTPSKAENIASDERVDPSHKAKSENQAIWKLLRALCLGLVFLGVVIAIFGAKPGSNAIWINLGFSILAGMVIAFWVRWLAVLIILYFALNSMAGGSTSGGLLLLVVTVIGALFAYRLPVLGKNGDWARGRFDDLLEVAVRIRSMLGSNISRFRARISAFKPTPATPPPLPPVESKATLLATSVYVPPPQAEKPSISYANSDNVGIKEKCCPYCSARIIASAFYCEYCGRRVIRLNATDSMNQVDQGSQILGPASTQAGCNSDSLESIARWHRLLIRWFLYGTICSLVAVPLAIYLGATEDTFEILLLVPAGVVGLIILYLTFRLVLTIGGFAWVFMLFSIFPVVATVMLPGIEENFIRAVAMGTLFGFIHYVALHLRSNGVRVGFFGATPEDIAVALRERKAWPGGHLSKRDDNAKANGTHAVGYVISLACLVLVARYCSTFNGFDLITLVAVGLAGGMLTTKNSGVSGRTVLGVSFAFVALIWLFKQPAFESEWKTRVEQPILGLAQHALMQAKESPERNSASATEGLSANNISSESVAIENDSEGHQAIPAFLEKWLSNLKGSTDKAVTSSQSTDQDFSGSVPQSGREFRTWKTYKGKTLQASFEGVEGRNVTLTDMVGKFFQVDVQSLVQEDQAYVAHQIGETRFKEMLSFHEEREVVRSSAQENVYSRGVAIPEVRKIPSAFGSEREKAAYFKFYKNYEQQKFPTIAMAVDDAWKSVGGGEGPASGAGPMVIHGDPNDERFVEAVQGAMMGQNDWPEPAESRPAERQPVRPVVASGSTSVSPKDAGAVANAYIGTLLRSGEATRANLVGYQRGLGVPLIAIFEYEGYMGTRRLLRQAMMSAALQPDDEGNWQVVNFEEGGVFTGLPLRSDWRQVVNEDGKRAQEVRRRGY